MDEAQSFQSYLEAVQNLTRGDLDKTAEQIRNFRKSPQSNDVRQLISARLSLKTSGQELLPSTDQKKNDDSFIRAEKLFVRGLECFHNSRWAEGCEAFETAAQHYPLSVVPKKTALAKFNAFIGFINAHLDLENEKQILLLQELLKIAVHFENLEVEALIGRQKSYCFAAMQRFHASLFEAERALQIFDSCGSHSDRQLTLICAADAALELGEKVKALSYLESVVEPIEARVRFSFDFMRWRLGLMDCLDRTNYSYICPHFSERCDVLAKNTVSSDWAWDSRSGHFVHGKRDVDLVIRPQCLEGKMLSLLTLGAESKISLCEKLWPEYSDVEHLDNRLHRLVCRLNKKLRGSIHFDGRVYRLQA